MGILRRMEEDARGGLSPASILMVTLLLVISALPLTGLAGHGGVDSTLPGDGGGQTPAGTGAEEPAPGAGAEGDGAATPQWGVLTRDGMFTIDDLLAYMTGFYEGTPDEVPRSGTPYFYELGHMGPSLSPDFAPPDMSFTDDDDGDGSSSRTDFQRKYDGTHCDINLDNDTASYVSQSALNTLGNEFDTLIHPTNSDLFDKNGNVQHIEINIYRFGDGAGGVGGYFSPQYSNYVFIDSDDMSWADEILAHEFQHLIHFDEDPWEEIWINEGCSDFAIFACYGIGAGSLQSHIYYFTQYPDDDLTQWGQTIVDYGQAVAFIIYLWEHYGGDDFVTDLVDSLSHGTSSVTNVISQHGGSHDFQQAFRNWVSANHIDDTDINEGEYGYDTFNIDMELAASYSSYPVSGSGTVNGWAADYFRFTNGDDDLTISFDGSSSDTYLVNILQFGKGLIPSAVTEMELGGSSQDGEVIVTGFGSAYSDIVLAVSSASGSASYSFDIILGDITPPITSLILSPDEPGGEDGWYTVTPTVQMQTDETGTTIYYSIDDGEEKTYTGEFDLPEGEHTFYFHAEDDSDNVEISRSFDFKVDTVGPTTELVSDPEEPDGLDGWYVTMPEMVLEVSEDGADSWYRWEDSSDWYNFGSSIHGRAGIHALEYYSDDPAGNTELSQTIELKVDVTTPVTTLHLDPPHPDGNMSWYRHPVTATFEVAGEENDFTTWYALDDEYGEYTMYDHEGDGVVIPEGVHTLYYYSADIAGNEEGVAYHEFMLDTVPPVVNHTLESDEEPNDEGWYHTSVKVYLEADNTSATIMYAIDDDDDFEYYSSGVRIPDGVRTLYYYGVDEAGNAGEIKEVEILVDTETPSSDITVDPRRPEASGWYQVSPRIELEADEEDATILYRLVRTDVDDRRGRSDEPEFTQYRRAIDVGEGKWSLEYYAVDPAGNAERQWEDSFDVDLRAPKALLEASAVTVFVGDSVTFTAINSSDTMGIDTYAFDFADGTGAYTEGKKHAGDGKSDGKTTHVFGAKGTFNVTLVVEDVSGRESKPAGVMITVREIPRDDDTSGGALGSTFSSDGDSNLLILIIIIAIVVILVAVILTAVVMSRRKKEEEARRRAAAGRRRAAQQAAAAAAAGAAATAAQGPPTEGQASMEPVADTELLPPPPPEGGVGAGAEGGALEAPDEMKLLPPPPSPVEPGSAEPEPAEDEKEALKAEEEALDDLGDADLDLPDSDLGDLPAEETAAPVSRPKPPRRSGRTGGFRAKGAAAGSGPGKVPSKPAPPPKKSMAPVGISGRKPEEPVSDDIDDDVFDL